MPDPIVANHTLDHTHQHVSFSVTFDISFGNPSENIIETQDLASLQNTNTDYPRANSLLELSEDQDAEPFEGQDNNEELTQPKAPVLTSSTPKKLSMSRLVLNQDHPFGVPETQNDGLPPPIKAPSNNVTHPIATPRTSGTHSFPTQRNTFFKPNEVVSAEPIDSSSCCIIC